MIDGQVHLRNLVKIYNGSVELLIFDSTLVYRYVSKVTNRCT